MVKERTDSVLNFILMILFIAGCNKKEKITPEIRPITESVYASGYAKAAGQYQVYPNVSGIIEKVHVQEGDTVKAGTALFTIEKKRSELSTEDARLALQQAEEDLKDIEDIRRNTQVAKETFLQDSLMYERYKKLREHNAVSGVTYENQKLKYENSRQSYFNALNNLNQTKSKLDLQYQRALTNLRLSLETEEEYVISSKIEGKVYNIIPKQGEGVNPQTLL
ncbi:MAG TPA: biotin/lipoyl-binding protein, partial [Cytophagaceae bacterium]